MFAVKREQVNEGIKDQKIKLSDKIDRDKTDIEILYTES